MPGRKTIPKQKSRRRSSFRMRKSNQARLLVPDSIGATRFCSSKFMKLTESSNSAQNKKSEDKEVTRVEGRGAWQVLLTWAKLVILLPYLGLIFHPRCDATRSRVFTTRSFIVSRHDSSREEEDSRCLCKETTRPMRCCKHVIFYCARMPRDPITTALLLLIIYRQGREIWFPSCSYCHRNCCDCWSTLNWKGLETIRKEVFKSFQIRSVVTGDLSNQSSFYQHFKS